MVNGVRQVTKALNDIQAVKDEGSRAGITASGEEGDAIIMEAQKKLFPLYETMLKKGYDNRTLTA